MSDWPPVYEETFDFGAGVSPARHRVRVTDELRQLPRLAGLSEVQFQTLVSVVFNVDCWASSAAKDLRDCPWPLEHLRAPMPETITRQRDVKAWRRFKTLLDCHDACWAVRDAVFAGDWIDAINWALMAGNRSLLDQAAIGRASLNSLPKRGAVKPRSITREARNESFRREADEIRSRNPSLSQRSVADTIARRQAVDALSVDTIRKIITPR